MSLRLAAGAVALAAVAFAAGRALPGLLGTAVVAVAAALAAVAAARRERRRIGPELVTSLVQPALLFSADGRLVAANHEARQLLELPDEAADVTSLEPVGDTALVEAVREASRTGAPVVVDSEHDERVLRSAVSRVGDQILVIVTDRTQERRVEELRRSFVVNASHELKTPVSSIQTLAEALEVSLRDAPDRVAPLVTRLGIEAERLTRVVRDLLDLRRLEDRVPLERETVDLAELTREIVAELVSRAEARDVELSVDAPDRLELAGVTGDLETIVKNLVSNGIQYNRASGRVEVRVVRRDGEVELKVADTGIGIPRQDLARIFERFYRVDTARSRETGGTGLGLSIVRHAVERNGGSIRVDSTLGEGTTFTVTLPVGGGPDPG